MAKLIMTNGTIKDITPNNGESFSLSEMQSLVGDLIESVDLRWLRRTGQIRDGEGDFIIVNEEGLLIGLPFNPVASDIAGRGLVGHAILCSDKEFV